MDRTLKNSTSEINILCIFFGTLVFTLTYLITLKLPSDFPAHINWAMNLSIVELIKIRGYFIWHLLVLLCVKFLYMPEVHSAAFVTSIFNVLSFIIIYEILKYYFEDMKYRLWITLFAFILMFVTPIYIPWFNENIYLGQGSPNLWHNPTNNAVKPFAILCFFMFIEIYKHYKQYSNIYKKYVYIFSIVLFISNFIKPSFIQFFLPSVGLLIFIEFIYFKGKNFKFCLGIFFAFLPSILLLLIQYLILFDSSSSELGVTISWLTVWSYYSPNIIISIILALLFPIIVIIQFLNGIVNTIEFRITIISLVISILEFALFMIPGSGALAGDFSWSYNLSLSITWIMSVIWFLNSMNKLSTLPKKYKIGFIIGYIFLFFHFITGIYYYTRFFIGGNVW